MKPKKTTATFLIEELPNIVQLLTPAVILTVVAFKKLAGAALIGAFIALTWSYLDVKYERYFNKTKRHPHYVRITSIFLTIICFLMFSYQMLAK